MDQILHVLVFGILLGGIYGLVSIGLNLIFGVVRIVNFAQGELVMLGMYGSYYAYTYLGLNPYLAALIVAPLVGLLGMAIQRLVIQPLHNEPNMQIFATFGLLMMFQNIMLAATRGEAASIGGQVGASVLTVGDLKISMVRLLTFVATTLITIGLHFFLSRSMTGKSIRAVTQDKRAARVMGINVERTFLLTFGLGAGLAGLAGVMLTPIYSITPTVGSNFILAAFAVVVLGGLGSVWGAYFGGLIVGIVEAFAGYYIDPALKSAIWFIIFLIVLILRPSGLFGQVGAEEVGFREQQ
ncbi:branched-chain amino acid ABC transporter permease [Glaciimonas immobilis]|uniref:Branched-chain amino acid transport system permease protein n=1 Tax=Glaciimonas immobilis TaxID=728004 RepID=A0A840RU86_9BURK|nr:branched-chain amino acid ABC transporter permease [Glaciimonas immobilis]KAF3996459.1 branched-chain amino acid ABC transporter permease [Glaciimonas immobilis]MBB5201193.1 branched-chain amino acid transport system permease protein [Glaciimonas immobilis]